MDRPHSEDDGNISIMIRLSGDNEKYDNNDVHDELLHDRLVKKLGVLKPDEIYAYEPARYFIPDEMLVIDNIVKYQMDVHLHLLRQMKPAKSVGSSAADIFGS